MGPHDKEKPFAIDCFNEKHPRDEDNPIATEWFDDFDSMEIRFEKLSASGRFKCLIQYEDSPEEWVEIHRWIA